MKIQHISKRINYEMLLTHAKKIDLIEIIIIFIESLFFYHPLSHYKYKNHWRCSNFIIILKVIPPFSSLLLLLYNSKIKISIPKKKYRIISWFVEIRKIDLQLKHVPTRIRSTVKRIHRCLNEVKREGSNTLETLITIYIRGRSFAEKREGRRGTRKGGNAGSMWRGAIRATGGARNI